MNNEYYASLLRNGIRCAEADRVLFSKWENMQISTEQMIRLFRRNNKIGPKYEIEPVSFSHYLRTLGYIREDIC